MFCLGFLFCFPLQIYRCLLSFPPVTPVSCADTPVMSELKTVGCFTKLHKSNTLYITSSFYNTSCRTTCVYVLSCKLVYSTYSTLQSARAFSEASRNSEPSLTLWRFQAVKSIGKCHNRVCAVWPTSKGQGTSGKCLHSTVWIPGAYLMDKIQASVVWPCSSPLLESQLLCRSDFPSWGWKPRLR